MNACGACMVHGAWCMIHSFTDQKVKDPFAFGLRWGCSPQNGLPSSANPKSPEDDINVTSPTYTKISNDLHDLRTHFTLYRWIGGSQLMLGVRRFGMRLMRNRKSWKFKFRTMWRSFLNSEQTMCIYIHVLVRFHKHT